MHSKQFDGEITIHHNGDYSGDVKINVPKHRVEEFNAPNSVYEIEIPFEVLRSLVLDYIRNRTISNFESMTDDDLEEWTTAGFSSDGHTEKLTPGTRQSMGWVNEPHGYH